MVEYRQLCTKFKHPSGFHCNRRNVSHIVHLSDTYNMGIQSVSTSAGKYVNYNCRHNQVLASIKATCFDRRGSSSGLVHVKHKQCTLLSVNTEIQYSVSLRYCIMC